MSGFEVAVDHVLQVEGGYSDHPDDPGNWSTGRVGEGRLNGTKFGISAATYPFLDIRSLTRAQAKRIYEREYWDAIGADQLEPRLGFLAFDAAVNHGVARAKRWLKDHPTFHSFLAHRLRFYAKLSTFTTFGRGWTNRMASVIDAIGNMPNPIIPARTLHVRLSDNAWMFYELDHENPARLVGTKLYANQLGGGPSLTT